MAAEALNLKFCKVALLEQPNFQNGPFWKIRFYRTARSGKDPPIRAAEFPERAVLEKMIL